MCTDLELSSVDLVRVDHPYLLDVFINFNYVIVTIVRWSLMCLNDYPLGLGSFKPNPIACALYDWPAYSNVEPTTDVIFIQPSLV